MLLRGSIIAIATPMQNNGALDLPAFEQLLRWQLEQGCDGIVVSGTTGESPTLSFEEKQTLFALAKKIIADQVPLIAATGTNCTRATIELSKAANDLGIHYSLLPCPYYNKPTQNGLVQHYQAIAQALPNMQHILYSIPGRSVIRIETSTVIQLSMMPNIVGLKDSSSSIERIRELRAACAPDFRLLASDDEFAFDCVENGGDGVISVAANVLPAKMQAMVAAALTGDFLLAKQLNKQLEPMYQYLFCQSNPIPLKALLHYMKKIDQGIRLPLTWLEQPYQAELFAAYDLINEN
jgi:4-hydroxy-tetrahydrodipicolinate synthase